MSYNTESVDAIYLEKADYSQIKAAGPGAFTYTYEVLDGDGEKFTRGMDSGSIEDQGRKKGRIIGMIHFLPGAGYGHIPIRPYNGNADSWEWDGNIEKPTLTPSVHAMPQEAKGDYPGRIGWHGHLTEGRWVSC